MVDLQAAETELANTASVRLLMAAEEEVKARAAVRRGAYSGPLLRYHSLRVGDESVVRCSFDNEHPLPLSMMGRLLSCQSCACWGSKVALQS